MAHKPGHILGKNEDSWNYLEIPTFPTIRGKVPYNKPIKLEDSTGFEDLQAQFDSGSNRGRTVEQKVEDYQGLGSGRIIIKGKTNTPEGIFFYPDNTEYAQAAVKDISDYQNLEEAFQSLAILGGATAAKARQNYNRPRQYLHQLETEKLNNIKPKNSAHLVNKLDGYFGPKELIPDFTTGSLKKGGLFDPKGQKQIYYTGSRDRNYVEPTAIEIHDKNQKLFKWWGNKNILYGKGAKFNYGAFKGSLTSGQRRSVSMIYSSVPHYEIGLSWDDHRSLLIDNYTKVYGSAMEILGYKPEDIEIDHIYTLIQSMPIYNDVKMGSELYNKIQKRLLQAGYKSGNAESNLVAADPQTHRAKSSYYNAVHGPEGDKFFTPKIMAEITRQEKLGNDQYRLDILDKYIKKVNEGTRILNEGQAVFETLYSTKKIMPEELVEKLSSIQVDAKGNVPQYSTKRLTNIITEIINDYELNPIKRPPNITNLIKEFTNYTPELDIFFTKNPKGMEMLVDKIKGSTTRQLKKRYKNYNPDQLELVFNQLTPQMVQRIMKQYGMSGKEGYIRDLNKNKNNIMDNIFGKDENNE